MKLVFLISLVIMMAVAFSHGYPHRIQVNRRSITSRGSTYHGKESVSSPNPSIQETMAEEETLPSSTVVFVLDEEGRIVPLSSSTLSTSQIEDPFFEMR